MKYEKTIIFIMTVIVAAVIVGCSTYWWQQSVLEKEKSLMQQQINGLQQQINDLTRTKSDSQQQLDESAKEPEKYVKVISPNGGETICLDENFIIEWESKGIDSVKLFLLAGGGGWYNLGGFPATYNEAEEKGKGTYVWKVGETKQGKGVFGEGEAYKIQIESAYDNVPVIDISDGVFSIIICKG